MTLIELSIAEKMHCYSRHVLLTEQLRGNRTKVKDFGLRSNWAPGREGRLPSHLLTRPFSRGIDGGQGCQGYRLRVQNDVKLKVKRLNRQV